MTEEGQRICKGPGCTNSLPPRTPGHKAVLACSVKCRKAASRAHLREEARRREEEARQQRQARWQPFLPTTRSILSRVEALGGSVLAEALAEAIRSEREHPSVPRDPEEPVVKHPTHKDFVKPLRDAKQPKAEPLAIILTGRETILAKRLEAIHRRLSTLRARRVSYRMTDREERALETLLSLAVAACWEANPELTEEEKGGKS